MDAFSAIIIIWLLLGVLCAFLRLIEAWILGSIMFAVIMVVLASIKFVVS